MKYIFADSIDTVDPGYDFLTDRFSPTRSSHWDDLYPHELMATPPYAGVLVSRGIVGDHRFPGKYTPAQAMRFRRLGARKFLRLDTPKLQHMPIFGDCGAFSYVTEDVPHTPPQKFLSSTPTLVLPTDVRSITSFLTSIARRDRRSPVRQMRGVASTSP